MDCLNSDEFPIHDSDVYGYRSDCTAGILVLHTFNEYVPPDGVYIDVIFRGVEVHRIEDVCRGNILFDIFVEEMPKPTIGHRFDPSTEREYGEYLSVAIGKECKIFKIHTSCGLSGWVAAQSAELVKRSQRAADICLCS